MSTNTMVVLIAITIFGDTIFSNTITVYFPSKLIKHNLSKKQL